jgi:hypothetical protein
MQTISIRTCQSPPYLRRGFLANFIITVTVLMDFQFQFGVERASGPPTRKCRKQMAQATGDSEPAAIMTEALTELMIQ